MPGMNTLCYLLYLYSEGSALCVALCFNVYLFHRRNALSHNLARAVGDVLVLLQLVSLLLNFSKKSNFLDLF